MKPYAVNDRVIVLPDEKNNVSAGGIVLPESKKKKEAKGTVMAVGPGAPNVGGRVPMSVMPGERVAYGQFAGTDLELDGVTYLVIRDDDILARLTDEPWGHPQPKS